MEKVFFVENERYLNEVNEALAEGGKVKMISAVAESMGGQSSYSGDAFAYIVVEMPN